MFVWPVYAARRLKGRHFTHGKEAIGDRSVLLAQPVRVGETGIAKREQQRSGVGCLDEILDRPPQQGGCRRPAATSGRFPRGPVGDLSRGSAEDRFDLSAVLSGQQPAVEADLADRRPTGRRG